MGKSSTPRCVPARSTLIPTRPGPIRVAHPAKKNATRMMGTTRGMNLRICIVLLFSCKRRLRFRVRRHVMVPNPVECGGDQSNQRHNNQDSVENGCIAWPVQQVKRLGQQIQRAKENQNHRGVNKSGSKLHARDDIIRRVLCQRFYDAAGGADALKAKRGGIIRRCTTWTKPTLRRRRKKSSLEE